MIVLFSAASVAFQFVMAPFDALCPMTESKPSPKSSDESSRSTFLVLAIRLLASHAMVL